MYLHGGPGSGCTPGARRYFDPQRHRAVLFDQRAAGRSSPHASEEGVHWASIDMTHHVADIERVRDYLGIERWIVVDDEGHGGATMVDRWRRILTDLA